MKNIIPAYTVILLILLNFSVSGKNISYRDDRNFAGFKASNISGYGLYYGREISDILRFQVMGLAYYYEYSEGSEKHTIINYDIGLEVQRFIYTGDHFRSYVLAGGYYYFDDDTKTKTDETNIINHSYNVGTGLGFEFYYKKLVINIDLGYKFFEDNLKTYINGDYAYPELRRTTKTGAGIGLGFMF